MTTRTVGIAIAAGLVCLLVSPAAARAADQPSAIVQFTPNIPGGKMDLGKGNKLVMSIDIVVLIPPGRRETEPTKKTIGVSWNFNNGSSANDVTVILGGLLEDALKDQLKNQDVSVPSVTITTTSIIVKGPAVVGTSSGSGDTSKGGWEVESKSDGKKLPHDANYKLSVHKIGNAPPDGNRYVGALHVHGMGIRTGEHGPSVASSSTYVLVHQGMTGHMIALALRQALTELGWDAAIDPADPSSVSFGTMADGIRISAVRYRLDGFPLELPPEIEQDSYHLALTWWEPEEAAAGGR